MVRGRCGSGRGLPISRDNRLVRCRQLLDCLLCELALGWREVVAQADAAQLAAKAGKRATPLSGRLRSGDLGVSDQPAVVRSDSLAHARREVAGVRRRSEPADPDRRFPSALGYIVCEPLELFAVASVARQRDQPIEELCDSETLELAPNRDPRGRWLAR